MTTTHKKAAQARSEYPNTIFEVWPMIIFASRKPGLQMCTVQGQIRTVRVGDVGKDGS